MIKLFKFSILFFIAGLAGCSESSPLSPSQNQPKIQVNQSPAPLTPKPSPPNINNVKINQEVQTPPPPPVYVYNPEGRRDPFKSVLQGGPVKLANPAFPLLNFPVSDLKLIAIIMTKKNNHIAMLQTPDGKGYTVRTGAEVGNNRGKVGEITNQSISIEEEYTDISGERKKREVVLSLRSPEEG